MLPYEYCIRIAKITYDKKNYPETIRFNSPLASDVATEVLREPASWWKAILPIGSLIHEKMEQSLFGSFLSGFSIFGQWSMEEPRNDQVINDSHHERRMAFKERQIFSAPRMLIRLVDGRFSQTCSENRREQERWLWRQKCNKSRAPELRKPTKRRSS